MKCMCVNSLLSFSGLGFEFAFGLYTFYKFLWYPVMVLLLLCIKNESIPHY